ncbi:MAG TPA: ROK family protein [Pyrinomonadaceae bacterium]
MNSERPLLGLDIGGTNFRAALAVGSEIVNSRAAAWPPDLSPEREVELIADTASEIVREAGLDSPLAGVGVSLAALVDERGVVVQWPNRPAWRGLAFKALLEKRLAAPVWIEDDANAAALAEATLGAGRDYRDVLVLMIGTGVGAGLILNEQLFRGRNGWAGELGHVVMLPGGPSCSCGKQGCLQMLCSGRALERVAKMRGLRGAEEVTAAAGRGESWALDTLAESGRWLGLAAANVSELLDLEAVIVGGGLSGLLGAAWWTALEETLVGNLLNARHRRIALLRTELSDTAGLLGALIIARRANGETDSCNHNRARQTGSQFRWLCPTPRTALRH